MAKSFYPSTKPIVKQNVSPAINATVGIPQQYYQNAYGSIPYGWNPALPPPNIAPTKGIAVNNPDSQYPGGVYGAPFIDVQQLIRKQKKTFGLLAQSVGGTVNRFPVQLSGTAKVFLGLSIGNNPGLLDQASTIELKINNEIIITDLSMFFLFRDFSVNNSPNEYKSYPRPLSGTDEITLTINDVNVGNNTFLFTFYYL